MANSESPSFQIALTLLSFVVAVLLRPEIQKMVQEELDTVTRRERLPTFEDRPRLPFVGAVCQEVIRWRPVAPFGDLLLSTHLIHAEI
jgi:cytochrome P450